MELLSECIYHDKTKFNIDLKFCKFKWKEWPETPLGTDWKFNYVCMPETFNLYAESIRKFKIRPDDVFLLGFPKSGTSWAQEMVWLLSNDFNYKKASQTSQIFRFPLLELASLYPVETDLGVLVSHMGTFKSPRFFKSHLPIGMLPEELWKIKPKIIHISRDSKDAAVSMYHHYINLHGYSGTKDEFFNLYLDGKVYFSPYDSYISELKQLKITEKYIHYITYEEMKEDLKSVIKSTATFLGKSITDVQMKDLYQYLQPDAMRKNAACNQEDLVYISSNVYKAEFDPKFQFIRTAETNTFKKEMSEQHIKKFEDTFEKKISKLSLYDMDNYQNLNSKTINR